MEIELHNDLCQLTLQEVAQKPQDMLKDEATALGSRLLPHLQVVQNQVKVQNFQKQQEQLAVLKEHLAEAVCVAVHLVAAELSERSSSGYLPQR
jgi:hypothetical protein